MYQMIANSYFFKSRWSKLFIWIVIEKNADTSAKEKSYNLSIYILFRIMINLVKRLSIENSKLMKKQILVFTGFK